MVRVGNTGVVFTIGELAKRTGLPVKTIRFYSDEGLLPPTDRTHSGYRLYDIKAMARLELVKTLRELGLGLADVERALTREASVPEIASQHVDALDTQIRRLRLRRAVLRAVAKRGSELEEVKLMNKLASMSDDDRKRLLDEFWDEMIAGLEVDSEFYARMRSAKPELPDDPSPEQLEAWIEFAELVRDPEFRALIRGMSERHSTSVKDGTFKGDAAVQQNATQQENWFAWSTRAQSSLDAGRLPDSAEGRALADEICAASAGPDRDPSNPQFRRDLADNVEAGGDERAERYWQLLAIINGWPPIPTQMPAARWIVAAIRASA
ncbi:DNA-binding transcriptional regulator, MerR family [Amycolatopsis xylanica]|uniref:DNA-binding transcriptional regulator, MerR family n=1 Tax=Amycolatopsis xylanica TaxID=589385 RepID=A0A1H2Z312_9PSEU|nr:MerR family transcriptional regulator [Amycolatopsis xylanica]SDX11810.1 DNA-binding transcriptional regulator, MerR family [Amycolatopsis xylanica]